MNWDDVVKKAADYVVKIDTPSGSGTGFLLGYNQRKSFCMIATALHVVEESDNWQLPIRVFSHGFTSTMLLKESDRVVLKDEENDSAVIICDPKLDLPESVIPLRPTNKRLDIGAEIGWLGYPGIDPRTLCFFSGNVSAAPLDRRIYLVDGVAINGVSGGPVLFSSGTDGVEFVGVVSAYRANRLTGDTLPGLLIAQDVSHLHDTLKFVKSRDEAAEKKSELNAGVQASQAKNP